MATLVLYLLDNTGSMQSIRDVTVQQFNEMLDGLKNEDCYIRLVKFNTGDGIQVVTEGEPMKSFKLSTYNPQTNTPLHDAIGESIIKTDAWLAAEAEQGRTYRVLCVVHTDGLENSSTEWNLERVRKLIGEKKATGYWEFVYAGVGQEAWVDAQERYGMAASYHVSHDVKGAAAAAAAVTQAARTYAKTGKVS